MAVTRRAGSTRCLTSVRALMLSFAVLCGLALAATPAEAAFPGTNGKIAFVSSRDSVNPGVNQEIYTMNADGTVQTRVTNNPAYDTYPGLSPDGTQIVFETNRHGDPGEIYKVNSDGTGVTRLTNGPAYDAMPAWSPDGSKIVYATSRDGGYMEIYTMNPDGTNLVRLTNNAASDIAPAWSPDGTKIAFVSERDMNQEIYVMNANGGAQTRLTNNAAQELWPDWSPDGSKIVFQTSRDGPPGNQEVYVMNSDGTTPTNLSNHPSSDGYPVWSPDGARIAFSSHRGSNDGEIFTMNADGTGVTMLTASVGIEQQPDWGRALQSWPAPPYTAPEAATPIVDSLVPTFKPCLPSSPPNSSHSSPLSVDSCSPEPTAAVARVGIQSVGNSATLGVIYGNSATTANEADVGFKMEITDVRAGSPTGADYNPGGAGADLTMVARIRTTDLNNCTPAPCSGPYNQAATATDVDILVPINCTPTADTATGSTCFVNTTANTLMPNYIREGKQAIVQAFRVRINDAGANNLRGDADDTLFLQGGYFVP